MTTVMSALIKRVVPLTAALVFAITSSAHALTMKECGAKYLAAKKDGSLKGAKWNAFRKAQCSDGDILFDDDGGRYGRLEPNSGRDNQGEQDCFSQSDLQQMRR